MSEHIIETEVCAGVPFVPVGGTVKLREEIVRCEDCKRFSGYELEPHLGYCERYDLHEVRGNGFCAWACRKEQQ